MSWHQSTLGELVKTFGGLIQTGPFGAQLKQSEYTDEGVPVIMPTDISDGRVNMARIARVPETTAARLARHRIKPDTIVFPRRGEITKRAYVTEEQSGWVCGTGCLKIEAPQSIIFPKFLYYQMGTDDSIDWLQKNAVGATMLNLSGEILARYPVRFPDLPTQQRIASILSAYDDLIENNRRRIALLEQAARLLHREWFVHLRFPGHETAKIVDGLPEGWQTHLLGQVADFHLGKMLDQNKNKGDSLPYLANVNVRWGEFELSDLREMRFEERELERFGLRNGDIVMCEGGEPGRCAIWRDQLPRMMFQKALHRIRPLKGINSEYLYRTLSYQAKRGHLSGFFTGSTIKHLPKEKLALVTIVVPSQEVLDDFERIVTPMSHQAAELAKQNAKLARARDLLLPRLMDGRIPV